MLHIEKLIGMHNKETCLHIDMHVYRGMQNKLISYMYAYVKFEYSVYLSCTLNLIVINQEESKKSLAIKLSWAFDFWTLNFLKKKNQ